MAARKKTDTLGAQLARAFEASGLTKTELCDRMETSMTQVNRLLNPGYTGHTVTALQRFADATNTKLEVRLG